MAFLGKMLTAITFLGKQKERRWWASLFFVFNWWL
jgi:hypothetical protein